ncbi:Os10g0136625, partial [Oryza sativa Japonica Group]
MQHRLAVVEHVRLIPEVAPCDMYLRTHAHGHGGVDHAGEAAEARQAVAGGQVRRALRQRVHQRERPAGVHDARRKPPRGAGRPLHRFRQKLLDEAGDEPHVLAVAGDVVDVPPLEGLLVFCGVGRIEKVLEGVDAGAVAVVSPGRVVGDARLVDQSRERVGDGFAASCVVEVAAAEREDVDHVGGLAGGGGGVVVRGGGGFVGEGCGHELEV